MPVLRLFPRSCTAIPLLVIASKSVLGEGPLDLDHALKIIETCEHRVQSAQWKVEYASGYFDNDTDPHQFAYKTEGFAKNYPGGAAKNTRVVFEPWTGRYRYDGEIVGEWRGGAAPYLGKRFAYAFDGENKQWYVHSAYGKELPSAADPQMAEITPGKGTGFVESGEGGNAGVSWFPPMFQRKLLSDGLRDANMRRPVKIIEDKNGIWHIDALYSASGLPLPIRFLCDPSRGCVVTKADLYDPKDRYVAQKCSYDFQRIEPDFFVPREIRVVLIGSKGNLGTRIVYSDVKINEKFRDDIFRIDFPPGTNVTDYVNRKTYKAGDTVTSERDKMKKFVAEAGLWVEQNPAPPSRWWYWLIGAIVVVATGLGGFIIWRRKRRRPVVSATAIALLMVLLGSTQSLAQYQLDEHGNWVFKEKNGITRRVSHCGLNVALFALEAFKIEYNPKLVSAGLPPGEGGIKLSDLQAMLSAHGLEVHARQGATSNELLQAMRRGALAIVPVRLPKDEGNHYVVFKYDAARGLLLVDPPYDVKPAVMNSLESTLKDFGGLVLLIPGLPEGVPEQAVSLRFEPEIVDLGAFDVTENNGNAVTRQVAKITNMGTAPVMARQVHSSCGCIMTRWEGGLLRPGENRSLEFEIRRSAWGVGQIERAVTLVMADGSQSRMRFRGRGLEPEAIQQIAVLPAFLPVEISFWPDQGQQVIEKQATIIQPEKRGALRIQSDAEWLTFTTADEKDKQISLQVKISAERKLMAHCRQLTGHLVFSSREEGPPVTMSVTLLRRDPCRLAPFFAQLGSRDREPLSLTVHNDALGQADPQKLVAYAEPSGLDLQVEGKGHERSLSVRPTKATHPGYYLVHLAVEDEGMRYQIGSSLVHVSEQPNVGEDSISARRR